MGTKQWESCQGGPLVGRGRVLPLMRRNPTLACPTRSSGRMQFEETPHSSGVCPRFFGGRCLNQDLHDLGIFRIAGDRLMPVQRILFASGERADCKVPKSGMHPSSGRNLTCSIFIDIMVAVESTQEVLQRLGRNPKGVRFADLAKICDRYFGEARHKGSSHRIYRTPWAGDPRVNIQNDSGIAKAYQVRQVMRAIEKLEGVE